MLSNSIFHSLLIGIIGLCSMQASAAACQRTDINYLLEKGFTPTQITKLCTQGLASEKEVQPKNGKKPAKDQAIMFLQSAIAAEEINFSESYLQYTTRECINYDNRPPGTTISAKKFCGLIQTTIEYENATISNPGLADIKLFSKPLVIIKGNIKKRIINDKKINHLTKYEKRQLLNKLSSTNRTALPINNNINTEKVKRQLNHAFSH